MLSSAFHIIAAEKIGKQDERGFENAFAGSKILVILIGLTVVLVSILFGKPFFYAVYRQQGKELQELLGYFYPASFTVLQNMLIFQYSVYKHKIEKQIYCCRNNSHPKGNLCILPVFNSIHYIEKSTYSAVR